MEEVKKQGTESLFCPYDIALALKELGFDEPCIAWYYGKDLWMVDQTESRPINYRKNPIRAGNGVLAPLYQQAFRWFREKYQLHSTITSISQESWQWHIQKPGESLGKLYDEDFYTYEEAKLACLRKLIEIVKENL